MAEAIETDIESNVLDERQQSMLRYAKKLTLDPASVQQTDIHGLRQAGLDDREILDLAEVVAYYAYVNRIANGLGVELE